MLPMAAAEVTKRVGRMNEDAEVDDNRRVENVYLMYRVANHRVAGKGGEGSGGGILVRLARKQVK